jgi:DNA ligase-1
MGLGGVNLGLGLSYTSSVQAEPLGAMLATAWPAQADPAPYWVSEKLDGVRALWDGQQLRFRSGRLIAAPAWFTAAWPAQALDGELWMGRQTFDRLSGAVRRTTADDSEWRQVRYMVFDLPDPTLTFTERLARLRRLFASGETGKDAADGVDKGQGEQQLPPLGAWVQAVRQFRVIDAVQLKQQLSQVMAAGGEGLVLHRADAVWHSGRSEAVRKLKPVQDEEAQVVAHLPGQGRLRGRLGALLVQMPGGQRFALGSGLSDADREKPPPVGAWVSYRYRDRTPSGLPRFTSFLRVRDFE